MPTYATASPRLRARRTSAAGGAALVPGRAESRCKFASAAPLSPHNITENPR